MTALALTTKTAVRNFKGFDASKPPNDAWLDAAIASISERVERSLRRQTTVAERTERFDVDPSDGQQFVLAAYPVSASPVAAVSNDTARAFGTGALLGTGMYYLDTEAGIIRVDGVALAPGIAALQVVYTAGMAVDTDAFVAAYPDIAEAVAIQVANWWESRKRLGVKSITGPDGTVTLSEPLDYLEPLRRAIKAHKRKYIW